MRVVVTGSSGFIGRRLTTACRAGGDVAVGVDVRPGPTTGVVMDVRDPGFAAVAAGADAVVHLAGVPGVRTSWGAGFADHLGGNLAATEAVLRTVADVAPAASVVLASSSSVYGDQPPGPVAETAPCVPRSPYGVTKLAAERLGVAFALERGLRVTALRLFTVYGPGQRADMAVARLLDASLGGTVFPLLGGHQRRDLTFVDDTVDAFLAAVRADLEPGTVLNVGSGRPVGLDALVALVQRVVGRPLAIEHHPPAAGDVATTHADVTRARAALGWSARTELEDGIRAQLASTTNCGESRLLRSG